MPKVLYKMSDLKRHFEESESGIVRMLKRGLLEPPLPRSSEAEIRLWTFEQVRRAEKKIKNLSGQKFAVSSVRFTEKTKAKIRAKGKPVRLY